MFFFVLAAAIKMCDGRERNAVAGVFWKRGRGGELRHGEADKYDRFVLHINITTEGAAWRGGRRDIVNNNDGVGHVDTTTGRVAGCAVPLAVKCKRKWPGKCG